MKVRALKTGFAGGRRRYAGDVFKMPDGAQGKWFEVLEVPAREPEPAPKAPRPSRAKPAPEPEAADDLA